VQWFVAAALAHSLGHGEARHDLELHIESQEVVLTATVELPPGLMEHDEAFTSNQWLVAGLELRDGSHSATVSAEGTGRLRRAVARLPLSAEPTQLVVGDGTLLAEHNLFRWTVHATERTATAEQLEVFDGLRRTSIAGRWVRNQPRQLVVEVAAADTPSSHGIWAVVALITLAGAAAGVRYSSSRRANASAS